MHLDNADVGKEFGFRYLRKIGTHPILMSFLSWSSLWALQKHARDYFLFELHGDMVRKSRCDCSPNPRHKEFYLLLC